MPIIDNQNDLKTCVGGAINNSVTWSLIEYTYDIVKINHFELLMGADYVDNVLEAYSVLETDKSRAGYWFQRAFARLMVYEYANAPGIMTPTGLSRTTTENVQSAFKYQENEYRWNMLRSGYDCLDKALALAETDGSGWRTDRNNKASTRWVRLASHFARYTGRSISRYDYERLTGIIDDIGEIVISEIVPEGWLPTLYSDIIINSASSYVMRAYELLGRAVAALTLSEAVERGWAQVIEGRVVAQDITSGDAWTGERDVSNTAADLKILNHNVYGSKYIKKAIEYIVAEHENDSDLDVIYQHYIQNFAASNPDPCEPCSDPCSPARHSGIISF